jgi:hypothetical protein
MVVWDEKLYSVGTDLGTDVSDDTSASKFRVVRQHIFSRCPYLSAILQVTTSQKSFILIFVKESSSNLTLLAFSSLESLPNPIMRKRKAGLQHHWQ